MGLLCWTLALIACTASTDDREVEAKRIQGTWVQKFHVTPEGRFLIAVEGGGIITTTFKGDAFTEISGTKEAAHGTFRIDLTKRPNEIDLVHAPDPRFRPLLGEEPKSTTFKCIYKLTDDKMTICYSLKERPTAFVAKGEDFIIEFERKK